MIEVQLYAGLRRSSDGGSRVFEVKALPGLTVKDVVDSHGIPAQEVRIVMINGRGANLDSFLSDGDRIALFPAVSGG
jgi:sulfur-carrier protein